MLLDYVGVCVLFVCVFAQGTQIPILIERDVYRCDRILLAFHLFRSFSIGPAIVELCMPEV